MLCRTCRRQVPQGSGVCPACGAHVPGHASRYDVVLRDGTRVPLGGRLTVGRGDDNELRLEPRTVSTHHAVMGCDDAGPWVEDIGSRHGTQVDGRRVVGRVRLHDGAQLHFGLLPVSVESHREPHQAGRTIVVAPRVTVFARSLGPDGDRARCPRLRSGWRLKRLPSTDGERRYVLQDLRGGGLIRLGDGEARLLAQMDGTRTLESLITGAEARGGADETTRLLRLLAELGQRGMLSGVDPAAPGAAPSRLARLLRPRYLVAPGVAPTMDALYRRGGWLLFTRPARLIVFAVALLGPAAFALLLSAGVLPFRVGSSGALGAAVFIGGRLALVTVHELAHALTLTSYGRRIDRAGLKWVLAFPYAFVDTTEAWLEPRARRLRVTAAGPLADLAAGGTCALAALAASGTARDVWFQLALGCYIGSLYNLNPLLDRDGYALLVDALGEPGLRRRAQIAVARRLSRHPAGAGERRAVTAYGVLALAWTAVGAAFALLMVERWRERVLPDLPTTAAIACVAVTAAVALSPLIVAIGRPLGRRFRRPTGGHRAHT